jgi:hypothetical protein
VSKTHSVLKRKNITRNNKDKKTMGIKGKLDKMVVLACEDCKERNYTTTKKQKKFKRKNGA